MSTVGSSSSLEVSSSESGADFFGFVGSGAETGCYKDVNSAYLLRQGNEMGKETRRARGLRGEEGDVRQWDRADREECRPL